MDIYYEAVAAGIVRMRNEGMEPTKIILGSIVYDFFKEYQKKITEGKGGEDMWFGLPVEKREDIAPDHFYVS